MPTPGDTVVIVGAGQAGAQAAITLRAHRFAGRVVLLGEEPHAPYMRPPLSKKFLSGELEEDRLYLRPASFYDDQGIELRLDAHVDGVDRARSEVRLRDGSTLRYDRLLLATGTRARKLALPGAAHPDVLYLRSLGDSALLRERLAKAGTVAVIGGGYLGLEVAATAAQAGLRVTVLERAGRLLERVTTPALSRHVEQVHRSNGVDVRCGTTVTGLSFRQDRLRGVQCDQGLIPADLALVGIGAQPNDELARAAGLACDDGIVVDETCRTCDPRIYAAGDCTRHPNPLYHRRLRLESVQNAVDQSTIAAINMAGERAVYARVPWFWSQQYGLKLQSAGFFEGCDEIVERGDRSAHRFALLYHRAGQLIGIDAVNLPAEYLAARKRIAAALGEVAIPPSAREHGSTADPNTPSFAHDRRPQADLVS